MAGSAGMTTTVVSFKQDIMPIFQTSCGLGANGCHGSDAYAAHPKDQCRGWLSLLDKSQGKYCPDDCVPPNCQDKCGDPTVPNPTGCPDRGVYQRLTELSAWNCDDSTHRYVVPGDPDNSYVYQKITGQNVCEKSPGVPSDRMPLGAPLEETEIATIRAWILQGAKDN